MSATHRLIVGNTVELFDTAEQFQARVDALNPPDPATIAAITEIDKEVAACRNLLSDLRFEFKKQVQNNTLTVAQASDIFNRVAVVLNALSLGWLRESRVLANNTATGGAFTQGRKDFLVGRIDAYIAQL